jgi:hypothetical protein
MYGTRCLSDDPNCHPSTWCDGCFKHELRWKRGHAATIGSMWAEKVCVGPHRTRESWPEHEAKTLAIAARKVAQLAGQDPRLVPELAAACTAGAAAWWRTRPAHYREVP